MLNILLIGNGAREHAIAEAIMRSGHRPRLFSYMKANNPGIASLSENILTAITPIWRPLFPLPRPIRSASPLSARKIRSTTASWMP